MSINTNYTRLIIRLFVFFLSMCGVVQTSFADHTVMGDSGPPALDSSAPTFSQNKRNTDWCLLTMNNRVACAEKAMLSADAFKKEAEIIERLQKRIPKKQLDAFVKDKDPKKCADMCVPLWPNFKIEHGDCVSFCFDYRNSPG